MEPTQTNTPPPAQPATPSANPFPAGGDKTSTATLIGAVIVILAIIAGIWCYTEYSDTEETLPPVVTENTGGATTESDAAVEALSKQGSSDEVAAIEADLQATDLNSMTTDLDKI